MEQEKLKVREFDGIKIPTVMTLKGEGKEAVDVDIVHTFLGKFSHAKAKCRYDGKIYVAEGLSRRSILDKPSDDRAYSVATGRALKGLLKKIKGKSIQNPLMA